MANIRANPEDVERWARESFYTFASATVVAGHPPGRVSRLSLSRNMAGDYVVRLDTTRIYEGRDVSAATEAFNEHAPVFD